MTALVTGGGNGIGAATAVLLAQSGLDVVVSDINFEAAAEVASRITAAGGQASAELLDVATAESWQHLAAKLRGEERSPHVIVNNAFQQIWGSAHELKEEDWDTQLSVSLGAVYRSFHTFHTSLVSHGGSVVNVSSVHGIVARPSRPAYAAAKGGIISLTRQLAVDYAPRVRVNCVIPGSIETRVWDGALGTDRLLAESLTNLGRLGRPEEVGAAIVFLALESASYITGTSLVVDGGQSSWAAV